jgi:bifunctional non-homologous end joining protein LigD
MSTSPANPNAAAGDHVTLYYREGSSDKVYTASIDSSGGGFLVNFAYGRRGSTLQTGCKTAKPVGYAEAKKLFDKLVAEKTAKGYSPGAEGTPYQHTDKEQRSTGVIPQLLNAIEDAEAERLVEDEAWWAQEKFDGRRVLVRRDGDGEQVTGINRQGLTIGLPEAIVRQARALGGAAGRWLIDGEAVGDVLHAFDLLEREGEDLRGRPYAERHAAMVAVVGSGGATVAIRCVETAKSAAAKRELWHRLAAGRREGIVFKRHGAGHAPGRPASGGSWVKLKFTATASCVVAAVNRGKRSVSLELCGGGVGKRVGVGSVTIPAGRAVPSAGAIVEVRYLYAYEGGALYQPVFLGERDDMTVEACVLSQLKLKPAGGEEEG